MSPNSHFKKTVEALKHIASSVELKQVEVAHFDESQCLNALTFGGTCLTLGHPLSILPASTSSVWL